MWNDYTKYETPRECDMQGWIVRFFRRGRMGMRWGLMFALIFATAACASTSLGRRFAVNPLDAIKVGHDQKKDILKKMGRPYRRSVDSRGREVFTYLWADGKGAGQKCTIGFNKSDVVYVVEVYP